MVTSYRNMKHSLKVVLVSALAVGCGGLTHGEADAGANSTGEVSDGADTSRPGSTDVLTTAPPSDAPTDVASSIETRTTETRTTETPVDTRSELPTVDTAGTTGSTASEPTALGSSERDASSSAQTSAAPSTTVGGAGVSSESNSASSDAFISDSTPAGNVETDSSQATSTDTVETSSDLPESVAHETTEGTYTSTDGEPTVTPSAIDWLNPPSGVPFDLPPEYDFAWANVDERVLYSWYDDTQCARAYDRNEGELGFIECDGGNGDDWTCRCHESADNYDGVTVPAYFVQTSFNNGDACRLGAALCLTDLPSENEECYDAGVWLGYSAQACTRDDRCDYRYSTPNGDLVKSVLMPFVECRAYEDDYPINEPGYDCLGSEFDVRGRLDAIPGRVALDACDVGYQVFFHGVDPGSLGPQSCAAELSPTVEVRDGVELFCDGSYQCKRPATTLGEHIELIYHRRDVSCGYYSGRWSCSCSGESTRYEYVGVDGATACSTILTECMSHPIP